MVTTHRTSQQTKQMAGGGGSQSGVDESALLTGKAVTVLLGRIKGEGGGLADGGCQRAQRVFRMVAVDDARCGA